MAEWPEIGSELHQLQSELIRAVATHEALKTESGVRTQNVALEPIAKGVVCVWPAAAYPPANPIHVPTYDRTAARIGDIDDRARIIGEEVMRDESAQNHADRLAGPN